MSHCFSNDAKTGVQYSSTQAKESVRMTGLEGRIVSEGWVRVKEVSDNKDIQSATNMSGDGQMKKISTSEATKKKGFCTQLFWGRMLEMQEKWRAPSGSCKSQSTVKWFHEPLSKHGRLCDFDNFTWDDTVVVYNIGMAVIQGGITRLTNSVKYTKCFFCVKRLKRIYLKRISFTM